MTAPTAGSTPRPCEHSQDCICCSPGHEKCCGERRTAYFSAIKRDDQRIEQAEARLAEALRLLDEMVAFALIPDGGMTVETAIAGFKAAHAAKRFLAAHPAPQGEVEG